MKRYILSLIAIIAANLAIATDYYWNGTGNINTAASWGTNTDGSGTHPTNFTTAGQLFYVQNGQTAALAGAWTVSGAGSKLVVQNGATFNASGNNATATVDLNAGSKYIATSTYSNLTFGTVDATSTFDFRGTTAAFRAAQTYGNLIFASGSTITPGTISASSVTISSNTVQVVTTNSTNNTWSISGDANINSSTTLALAPNSATSTGNAVINVGGGLTNSGTIAKGATSTGTATINFNGAGTSNVTWGTTTGPINVTTSSNKTLIFQDSFNSGGGNITINGTVTTTSGHTLSAGLGSTTVTGILNGLGTLAGTTVIANGGTLSPGNSAGIINNSGTLTFDSGSTYSWELTSLQGTSVGIAGTNFDQIVNTGTINFEGGLLALVLGSNTPSADAFWSTDQSWTIVSGGTITGTGLGIGTDQTAWASRGSFATTLNANSVTLSWTAAAAAIPEPSTYATIFGAVALAGAAYRRRQQAKVAKTVSV